MKHILIHCSRLFSSLHLSILAYTKACKAHIFDNCESETRHKMSNVNSIEVHDKTNKTSRSLMDISLVPRNAFVCPQTTPLQVIAHGVLRMG